MAGTTLLLLQALVSQWPLPRVTCVLDSFRPATREAVFKVSYEGSGKVGLILDARKSPGWPVRLHWMTSDTNGDPGYFVSPSEEGRPGAELWRPLAREDFVELTRERRPYRLRVKVPPESLHRGVSASPSQPSELTLLIFSIPQDVRDYLDSAQNRLWPNIDGNVWWQISKWRRFQTACTGLRIPTSRLADPRLSPNCDTGTCLDTLKLAFRMAREEERHLQILGLKQRFLDFYTLHQVNPRPDQKFQESPPDTISPVTLNRKFLKSHATVMEHIR